MTDRLDELPESGNDAANEIRNFMEEFGNRFHLDNFRLIERYRKREIHFLVRFSVQGFAEDFVACFEWASHGIPKRSDIAACVPEPQRHLLSNSEQCRSLGVEDFDVHVVPTRS